MLLEQSNTHTHKTRSEVKTQHRARNIWFTHVYRTAGEGAQDPADQEEKIVWKFGWCAARDTMHNRHTINENINTWSPVRMNTIQHYLHM